MTPSMTLEEVIYLFENRKSILIGKASRDEMENAILYYLKEYWKKLDVLNKL